MPGLFDSFKRMIKGEPVFQPGDDGEQPYDNESDDPADYVDKDARSSASVSPPPVAQRSDRTDGKFAPVVVVERTKYHIDDSAMELSVEIANKHNEVVYLDNIEVMGKRFELDRSMNPGEEREFRIYRGPRPTDTHMTRCDLRYRNASGDYFGAQHFVEYHQLQDGQFVIEEIRFLPPVKDI